MVPFIMWFVEKRPEILETRSTHKNDQIPATSGSAAVKGPPEELIDSLVNFEIIDATDEITSSTSPRSGYPDALLSTRDSSSANQVHIDANRVAKSDLQSEVQGSTASSSVIFVSNLVCCANSIVPGFDSSFSIQSNL